MSKLSSRVATRYQRLQNEIVVARWLLANQQLASGIQESLTGLRAGATVPTLKALDNLWMAFEIHEAATGNFTINAEWYYPLSSDDKTRVRDLIGSVKSLRRAMTHNLPSVQESIQLDGVIRDAVWLEGILPNSGFLHEGFTVVPMKGVSGADVQSCLGTLTKAAGLIREKFPEVLYGKVYLGKVSVYVGDLDTLSLRVAGDVHTVCHELGHRYFHKFWKDAGRRDRFKRLSMVTRYAKKTGDWQENFAESFALHVTGKHLPPEIAEILGSV